MEYYHSLEQSHALATKSLEMMQEHRIAATPTNFQLWYQYFCGEHPELKDAIDIILDAEKHISEEQAERILKKFCSSPLEALPLHLIAERVETSLAAALLALGQIGRDAQTYGDHLEAAQGQVLAMKKTSDLIPLLSTILSQTRAMAQQSRDVEKQMRQYWREINQLREELDGARREAMTDALTGLANRKMFDLVLREAAVEAMESLSPLCLLFIDIDHFKAFNDTYGHLVGDNVLKLLASVLKETIKGQDTAARYGGEEFAIILPNTSAEAAARLAEMIRQRVASKTIINRKTGEQLGRVHVSIGVSQFVIGEALRLLIERADRALYAAKRRGRNQVVCEIENDQKLVAFQG